MSDIRKRIFEEDIDEKSASQSEALSSTVEEKLGGAREPPPTDDLKKDTSSSWAPEVFNNLPQKWKNWVIRGVWSFIMIGGFITVIRLGPMPLVFMVLAIQIKCFQEIIGIGYQVYKTYDLPWFRTLSWYFLFASNYFFYAELFMDYFGSSLENSILEVAVSMLLLLLVTYHRFISFMLYVLGFCSFVLSLVKTHYLKQFILFGWTHIALLIVVFQSHLIIQNIFEGLVWFLIPVSMVIINDIWAYLFGFFFGRTPLIKLSPKKTWEGFIGGGFATIVFGLMLSNYLCQFDYMVCPVELNIGTHEMHMECIHSHNFQETHYVLPKLLAMLMRRREVVFYPFLIHAFNLSIFCSLIGPFGGFFASGFKRAFKIKDFADTFPGHGGFMDRFDCQYLMASFVNVYISSFVTTPSAQKLLVQFMLLNSDDQMALYRKIGLYLTNNQDGADI